MKRQNKTSHKTDFSLFAKYTSFNVMSMIGLSCYILADTYFISNGIGADGLTALNLAIPFYSFINGIGLMLGVGGATRYAIFRAQNRHAEGTKIFMNMVYMAIFFSVLLMAAGIFGSGWLARMLGADSAIYNMTAIYLKMILLFSPAFIMNNIINCFVRNDGDPRLSMAAMLAGSFANIVMDYIFIYPMGLGMFGAVLATGFAPFTGLLVLSLHFIRKRHGFRFGIVPLRVKMTGTSMAVGMSALVTEVSAGIVMIIYNIIILGIGGNRAVAAYGIIANIILVVLSIYSGIAQGMQPVISDAFGKGKTESTKAVLRYGVITMLLLSAFIYSGLFVKADQVALLFNRDRDPILQQIAIPGIRLYFAAIPFAGFNVILAAYFASMEKAVPAQIISWLRGIVLIIPIVFLLAQWLGLTGVWLSFLVTEGMAAILGCILLMKHLGDRQHVF